MKTIKNLLIAGIFFATLSTLANDKIVLAKQGDVTITAQDKMIQVSVLNTQEITYTVHILNGRGERIFTEFLGSEKSLGCQFDFSNADRGSYTFEFVGSDGERFQQEVRTGSW